MQVPLLTVHLNVAVFPAVMLVTVVVADVALVIAAVPATMLHAPVPIAGTVAFMVKVALLHCSINANPASAALGRLLFVRITSSVLDVQTPLLIVHLNVALVPIGTPVTPLVGDVFVVIVAVPPTTVHKPLPVAGEFPANVKLPLLH